MKAAAVFLIAFIVYLTTAFNPTPYNEQTRQATAMLHGHLSIKADTWIEHAEFEGHDYALHPPLAALLLVPFVAVDPDFDQGKFAIVIGALDVMLAYILVENLWLTAFFAFGTIIWYEAAAGSTWALPELVGVACILLTLIELFGKCRPWLVGILAGLGFLALYQLAFVIPVYTEMLHRKGRSVWGMATVALAAAIYVCLNEARYNGVLDEGLWFIPGHPGGDSQFGLQHLPFNLYTLLFMAPQSETHWPYIRPVWIGQSLTLTSPAFVMALKPWWRRFEMLMMGAAALLVAAPMLLCYANGYAQFGARHYIPMYPYLLVMMAQARTDQMAKILIVVSVVLVGTGIWEIHAFGL